MIFPSTFISLKKKKSLNLVSCTETLKFIWLNFSSAAKFYKFITLAPGIIQSSTSLCFFLFYFIFHYKNTDLWLQMLSNRDKKKKKEVCMFSLFELFECLHFSVSLDDLYHFYFNRTTLKSKNSLLLLSYSLVMCGFNRMIFFIVPL